MTKSSFPLKKKSIKEIFTINVLHRQLEKGDAVYNIEQIETVPHCKKANIFDLIKDLSSYLKWFNVTQVPLKLCLSIPYAAFTG